MTPLWYVLRHSWTYSVIRLVDRCNDKNKMDEYVCYPTYEDEWHILTPNTQTSLLTYEYKRVR